MAESVKAPLRSKDGAASEIDLPADIFGAPERSHLLYEAVRMQQANRRAGTHATKTRHFVRGGGKKPYRQKGTGNARAGSTRSPIWVGGATTFGPQPRDYSYRMPRQARKAALESAVSGKLRDGKLLVVDSIGLDSGKTRDAAAWLDALEVKSALVVDAETSPTDERALRNLPRVRVLPVEGLNVYDVLRFDTLILTTAAVERLGKRLAS